MTKTTTMLFLVTSISLLFGTQAFAAPPTSPPGSGNSLQTQMDTLNALLTSSVANLQAQINSLFSSLTQEITDRQSADTTLQSNIDSEISARIQGDIDAVASSNQYADSVVSSETMARQTADADLQSQINNQQLGFPTYRLFAEKYTDDHGLPLSPGQRVIVNMACGTSDKILSGGFDASTGDILFSGPHDSGDPTLDEGWDLVYSITKTPGYAIGYALCLDMNGDGDVGSSITYMVLNQPAQPNK